MDILKFYFACLRLAFKQQFVRVDGIAGFLGITGGLIGYYYPQKVQIMNQLTWQIPLGLYFVFVAGRLLFSPYWVYKETKNRLSNLEKQFEPSLQIDFEKNISPYIQEMPIKLKMSNGKEIIGINKTYRICIKNKGINAVDNIQVKLNSINPLPPLLYGVPLPLRFMHDRPPYKHSKQIARGQDEFIDVVSCIKGNYPDSKIVVEHIVDGIWNEIDKTEYVIEILVTGNNVTEAKRKFKIFMGNYELFMMLI